jgi:carboxyl-terminal processing protease
VERQLDQKSFKLKRRNLIQRTENVEATLMTMNSALLGILRIRSFLPENTGQLAHQATKLLQREANERGQPLSGVLLDLRQNLGGLLATALDTAGAFLPQYQALLRQAPLPGPHGEMDPKVEAIADLLDLPPEQVSSFVKPLKEQTFLNLVPEGFTEIPLVVLVDSASASASEVVSGILQESGRAVIVGQRTFGKGSVQTLWTPDLRPTLTFPMTAGAYYFTSGTSPQLQGVTPDFPVGNFPHSSIPSGQSEEINFSSNISGGSEESLYPNPLRIKKLEKSRWNFLPDFSSAREKRNQRILDCLNELPAPLKADARYARGLKALQERGETRTIVDYPLIYAATVLLCLEQTQN